MEDIRGLINKLESQFDENLKEIQKRQAQNETISKRLDFLKKVVSGEIAGDAFKEKLENLQKQIEAKNKTIVDLRLKVDRLEAQVRKLKRAKKARSESGQSGQE